MRADQVVASNRRARHDYEIVETLEAGMALLGSEVKSLRAGKVDLKDAYAIVRGGELWLENLRISPYDYAREGGHDPERPRKLLVKRREIDRLTGMVAEKGLTLVPMRIYFTHGLAKLELGVGKGKRTYDKRQAIRKREQEREMERAQRYRR